MYVNNCSTSGRQRELSDACYGGLDFDRATLTSMTHQSLLVYVRPIKHIMDLQPERKIGSDARLASISP
jgi:hypothetical protein